MLYNQVEFPEPPVPKARPPLRKQNISEKKSSYHFSNSDNALIMEDIQDIKQQTKDFLEFNGYDEYTDDEDDDVDNNESRNSLSQSMTPEYSFSSACNSSSATREHLRERSLRSLNTNRSFNSTNNSIQTYNQFPSQRNRTSNIFCNLLPFGTITVFLFIFLYIIVNGFSINETTQENESQISKTNVMDLKTIDKLLDESMQTIQTQFHHQKSTIWNDIASAIYDVVMYPEKPALIMFFGNDTDTLNCLAQMVGELSSTVLGSNDYLILTPKDFPNDVGRTVYNLKVKISQKKVVIVHDLLSINTEAIKAFHNFCDRENPLVKKVIYIMTLITDGYKPFESELEFIDKQIFKKLVGKIDKDILDPLVTRLTDGIVMSVKPELTTNTNKKKCSFS
ncbi:torsin interacting protein isoform X2 [Nomia melanderi]|uniref:torsin interacting protein isoform X2 n=1 Tax=Nomia melanderi TaxID=2448451 RepID=UPI00130416F5|nr:uncharacterized protein LOC116431235 isoform X2 [Nomia melanderi]